MAEHYTQGRQGQGSRRRRNNNHGNRRHRMPRPESAPSKKPSFVQRVLSFFGFGKKKNEQQKSRRADKKAPKSNTRIATGRSGNPAATHKSRRATSTPPTRNGRLYVGNLSYEATESELEELFKGFGHVRSVEVIYNPRTYKSKGYAFVEMVRLEDAQRAAEVLHGQPFMGRELMVSAASEKSSGDKTALSESAETEVTETAPETAEAAPAAEPAEAPAAEPAAAEESTPQA